MRRYFLYHGKHHLKDMGEVELTQFLMDFAVDCDVAASTQAQAINALLFLYKHVLGRPEGDSSFA